MDSGAATRGRRGPDCETGELTARTRRLRSPLLLALAALLGIDAVGGLVIFCARLISGAVPGEALHVVAGVLLTAVYAVYQWRHWSRVAPFRARLDYSIGLLAAISMVLTQATGLVLGLDWWRDRVASPNGGPVGYAPLLSAAHNIGSMLVLTFVGAHLGAVLMRDARSRR